MEAALPAVEGRYESLGSGEHGYDRLTSGFIAPHDSGGLGGRVSVQHALHSANTIGCSRKHCRCYHTLRGIGSMTNFHATVTAEDRCEMDAARCARLDMNMEGTTRHGPIRSPAGWRSSREAVCPASND